MKTIIITLFLLAFAGSCLAQCSLIESSKDALFLSFEREAMVKVDGVERLEKGIILRIHNNTSCAVLLTSGEPILKPLPSKPTIEQRIKRELDLSIADGQTVPFVQYRYQTYRTTGYSVGGDDFFSYSLGGNRSALFEVPFRHLDARFSSTLDLPFSYEWEKGSEVKNLVRFWIGELPEKVRLEINRSKR
jgi:hypothetical protein